MLGVRCSAAAQRTEHRRPNTCKTPPPRILIVSTQPALFALHCSLPRRAPPQRTNGFPVRRSSCPRATRRGARWRGLPPAGRSRPRGDADFRAPPPPAPRAGPRSPAANEARRARFRGAAGVGRGCPAFGGPVSRALERRSADGRDPPRRARDGRGLGQVQEGQARVEVDYKKLPPAILFGGDVTSYVVWAIARDGHAENLGELIARGDSSGSGEYRTGQKEFALLVTAEPYYLALNPSEIVCFTSLAPPRDKATSAPITFSGFGLTPKFGNPQIGGMQYNRKRAGRPRPGPARARPWQSKLGAEKYAADSIRQSEIALSQASNSFKGGNKKVGLDYARRSLSLSATAIRDTRKHMAEEEAAAAAARRAAEMQALEEQKASAQRQAAAAQEQALAERERALAAREQAAAAQAAQAAQAQKDAAETQSAKDRAAALRAQNVQLEKENERLMQERDDLAGRLTGALSAVAQISKTARGVVVNLPDILFDASCRSCATCRPP